MLAIHQNKIILLVLFSLIVFAGLSSCSTQNLSRDTASLEAYSLEDKLTDTEDKLEYLLNSMEAHSKKPITSTKQCIDILGPYLTELKNIRPSDVDVRTYRLEDFAAFVDQSFMIRLMMREQLRQLHISDDLSESCLTKVKDIYLALRYLEDYLIEVYHLMAVQERPGVYPESSDDYLTLMGRGPFFNINPKYKDEFESYLDLKSGDVILSRGNAYSSAAIARIGRDDMQFSHLSLVYEHPSGELYTVEAHIEIGSFAAHLQQHLDQRNARTVVFRHSDSKLAHKAAEAMYNRVIQHQMTRGENIPYNFAMDFEDPEEMFCSEIIYWGYYWASNGKLDIPRFRTRFEPELLNFLIDLNIAVDKNNIDTFETFSPGDMQFEPDFELVAEWRNPARIRDSRFKDMILTKIFDWMKYEDYYFHPPFGSAVSSRAAWVARRLPIVRKLLEDKFPLNMSVTQLELFMVLDKVGDVLYAALDKNHTDDLFNPQTPIELLELLEEYRKEDLHRYRLYQNFQMEAQRFRSGPRGGRPLPFHIREGLGENAPDFHQWFR